MFAPFAPAIDLPPAPPTVANLFDHPVVNQTRTMTQRVNGLHEPSVDALLFAWALGQTYGERADSLFQENGTPGQRMLTERLAAILASIGGRDGSLVGVSRHAFAECLGADDTTIAAMLRAFERQGLILMSPGRIDIIDPAALEELAYL